MIEKVTKINSVMEALPKRKLENEKSFTKLFF